MLITFERIVPAITLTNTIAPVFQSVSVTITPINKGILMAASKKATANSTVISVNLKVSSCNR